MANEVLKSAEDWIIDLKTIKCEEYIGSGNSCDVYKGEWRGIRVAIKKMKFLL